MTMFKVGDRVETRGCYSFDPARGTVVKTYDDDLYFVDVDGEYGPGCDPGWAYNGRDLAAAAPETAALKVGDYVVGKSNIGTAVSGPIEFIDAGSKQPYLVNGLWCWEHDIKLSQPQSTTPISESAAPAPRQPQVGDDVLIFGTIAGVTHSPRGTNYNIVFETQNRRMSLHFLEEDFIVVDDEGDSDCQCANNNGPVPSTDTAKAFDALGTWLRSLAVERAA